MASEITDCLTEHSLVRQLLNTLEVNVTPISKKSSLNKEVEFKSNLKHHLQRICGLVDNVQWSGQLASKCLEWFDNTSQTRLQTRFPESWSILDQLGSAVGSRLAELQLYLDPDSNNNLSDYQREISMVYEIKTTITRAAAGRRRNELRQFKTQLLFPLLVQVQSDPYLTMMEHHSRICRVSRLLQTVEAVLAVEATTLDADPESECARLDDDA